MGGVHREASSQPHAQLGSCSLAGRCVKMPGAQLVSIQVVQHAQGPYRSDGSCVGSFQGDVAEVQGPHAQLPIICRAEAGAPMHCQGVDGSFVQLHYAHHSPGGAVHLCSRTANQVKM